MTSDDPSPGQSDAGSVTNDPPVGRDRAVFHEQLTAATAVLGKKWYLLIMYELMDEGPLGFSELEANIDGVSAKVLSESLDDLSEKGLIERTVISDQPIRVEYSITADGHRFEPIIQTIRDEFDRLEWIPRTPDDATDTTHTNHQ